MRKLLLLVVLALVAVPAAFAENTTSPTDQASTLCKQQRTLMGTATFKLTYGGGSNAFGRCVSKLASTVSSDTANASKQCAAERADAKFPDSHNGQTFAQVYGGTSSHGNGSNAFGKCVSSKAKTLEQQQTQATVNAAKTCKTERTKMGAVAFTAKYGGHSNAFGKCVSQTAKATP
jgi:hypothetical protein